MAGNEWGGEKRGEEKENLKIFVSICQSLGISLRRSLLFKVSPLDSF